MDSRTTEKPGRTAPGNRDRTALAYHRLRELIVHGRLAPGTRVIETEIAERLGVSRTPVRSALQRLQQEGYIIAAEQGRQTRPFVSPLTQEDARELFSILGEIEGLAARRAAGVEAGERARLTERLRRINREYLDASRNVHPDRDRLFDLDTEFHRSYVAAGSGPRLQALHEAVKPQAERYIRLYVSVLLDQIATSIAEHDRIIDGIAAGDGEAAHGAVRDNWRNAALRLNRVILTAGERGSW
ncbi:MAG TPA: GntR family transcriptional regulator [Longimicrobiales bacterium]